MLILGVRGILCRGRSGGMDSIHVHRVRLGGRGFVYMMVALAFLRLRKTRPEWERPFKVRNGALVGILAFLFTVWVIVASLSEITLASLAVLGGYFAVGCGLYAYAKYMQRARPEEWKPLVLGPEHVSRE